MPVKRQKTGKPAHNRLNLVGQKFTRLFVQKFDKIEDGRRESLWFCICDCGNLLTVRAGDLRNGKTKSCGCYHRDHTRKLFSLPNETIKVNRVLGDYQRKAKKRGLPFELSREAFTEFLEADCYYCGASPSNSFEQHGRQLPAYQGIDRKDNTLGYTSENCVPCCIVCNKMKKAMNHDDFLMHIHRIATRFMTESPQPDFYASAEEGVLIL